MLCVAVLCNVLFVCQFAVDPDVFVAIDNLQLFDFLNYFFVFSELTLLILCLAKLKYLFKF